mmetsp:Transcript_85574/g.261736  ORF Transcript_85574/g.261736 Transcript_85574/m.261736 type:complete len:213 (-) Transcript_85574:975-1613(-)
MPGEARRQHPSACGRRSSLSEGPCGLRHGNPSASTRPRTPADCLCARVCPPTPRRRPKRRSADGGNRKQSRTPPPRTCAIASPRAHLRRRRRSRTPPQRPSGSGARPTASGTSSSGSTSQPRRRHRLRATSARPGHAAARGGPRRHHKATLKWARAAAVTTECSRAKVAENPLHQRPPRRRAHLRGTRPRAARGRTAARRRCPLAPGRRRSA